MDSLRGVMSSVVRLLPVLLIMMVVLGDLMFFAMSVLPAWQEHEALAAQVAAANVALSQRTVEQVESDPIGVLQSQVERGQSQLDAAAAIFLTDSQGDSILDRLYAYSDESGVDIINLQLQQPAQAPAGASPSEVRLFRLQVSGSVLNLMNFVMRVRGASLPSLLIENLSISEQNGEGLLTMDVSIYVSAFSDGAALDSLAPRDIPAPPLPTPTPIPPPAPAVEGG